jgi:hypothetical protein
MTEIELLERCERQAVEIDRLKKEVAFLQLLNRDLPHSTRMGLLDEMCRAGVNCGRSSTCSVAGWFRDAEKKAEDAHV